MIATSLIVMMREMSNSNYYYTSTQIFQDDDDDDEDNTILTISLRWYGNNNSNTYSIFVSSSPIGVCPSSRSSSLLKRATSPIPLLPPLPRLPTLTSTKLLLLLAILTTITLPLRDFRMVMMMIYNTTRTIPIPQTPPQRGGWILRGGIRGGGIGFGTATRGRQGVSATLFSV